MTSIFNITRALGATAIVAVAASCRIASNVEMGPQSHFSFPNSNVLDAGPVRVEDTIGPSFSLAPTVHTARDTRDLYDSAIAQVSGADLILDYAIVRNTYMIPTVVLPFNLYWTTQVLEGTAANMDISNHQLQFSP